MAAAGLGPFIFAMACLLPVPIPTMHWAYRAPSLPRCPQIAETQRQLRTLFVTFLALELGSWEPLAGLQVKQEQMQNQH